MDCEFFNEYFEDRVRAERECLCRKAVEYAEGGDRAHNFTVAAAFTGRDRKQEAFNFMLKHIISIRDMCLSGEDYSLELWQEKLGDARNYMMLIGAMAAEEETLRNKRECSANHSEGGADRLLQLLTK